MAKSYNPFPISAIGQEVESPDCCCYWIIYCHDRPPLRIDIFIFFPFHRRFAYLNDISIAPEMSLPFCIIEWLSQDQADEFLGFNSPQNFYQRVKSIDSYFRVGSHRFISQIKEIGSDTIIPCISFARLRISSSVVKKYPHPPAIAHTKCKASLSFNPSATKASAF